MKGPLLEVKNIEKSFDGNPVLKDINFRLGEGEILGICGENGAGKSTLMNILFGMSVIEETGGYKGDVFLEGEKLNLRSPQDALEHGIGMVHQEFSLIPGFTVAENVTLNMEETNSSWISRIFGKKFETVDRDKNIEISGNSMDNLGVKIDPQDYVSEMPVGHKQFIEIAREMTREDVKLIIMDEPTAVLTESEADILLDSLKRLSNLGIAIIFISHRLREILKVCDNIIVLRDGLIVENKPASQMSIDSIAQAMVGREKTEKIIEDEKRKKLDDKDIIMSIENLWVDMPGEQVLDFSLDIRRGEIVGIAGLAGHGKLGIPNGILGTYPSGGGVSYDGKNLNLNDTKGILKSGIAFVSEDRKGVGLLLDEPIYWNISFNAMQVQDKFLKKVLGINFRDEKAMREVSNKYISDLDIKTTGPDQKVQNLSGGNQQKVCLAKAFCLEPDLLFVSEPTRGIDIGAKKLVLDSLKNRNINEGTTIVMISSELEELRSICDRIAVVYEGKIAGILDSQADPKDFALLMSGEKLLMEERNV